MQYHWVVCFDEETNSFEIDWDLTYHALDGVMYNPSRAWSVENWITVGELTQDQEQKFESLSTDLVHSLDKLEIK